MFTLTGSWLAGALVLAYLVGAFTVRYIKDTLKGVPSTLRTALNNTEKNALAKLKAAEQKAINDVTGLLPAAAAAPAKTAAPAAPDVKAIGEKAISDIQTVLADVAKKV